MLIMDLLVTEVEWLKTLLLHFSNKEVQSLQNKYINIDIAWSDKCFRCGFIFIRNTNYNYGSEILLILNDISDVDMNLPHDRNCFKLHKSLSYMFVVLKRKFFDLWIEWTFVSLNWVLSDNF